MKSGFLHIFFRYPHHTALIIAILIGAIGAYFVYRRTNPPLPPTRRYILTFLRFLSIAVIIFMLADPVLLSFHRKDIVPSIALLVDDTQSLTIADNTGNRVKKVQSFLQSDALEKIEEKYPVVKFSFSDSIHPFDKLKFDGTATAIGEVLSDILDTSEALDIEAVVLVSDGQSNIGIDPVSISATLPFPVYAVGVGDPNPAPDASVAQVLSNPIAYVGEKNPIVANIRAWRLDGLKTKVSLWSGNEKIAEKQVELPTSGQTVPVKFEITPEKAGVRYYTVRIPKLSGEVSLSNNSHTVSLKVLPSKKKVLLACDHLSFEVSFIRRAIESDPHIETSVFAKRGGGDVPFKVFPLDTSKLDRYDAIVLIHFAPIMTEPVAKAITDYVKFGGSVFWMLDDSLPSKRALSKINEIMPAKISSGLSFIYESFVPVISSDGFTHPIMQIANRGEDLSKAIAGMPPFSGYVRTEPTDWASILLAHPDNSAPILAVGSIGRGRSAILCAAPFWKWGFLPAGFGKDDHIYRNLVSNLARYLVSKEKISRFVLSSGKRVYRSGEPVVISASLRDVSNKPISGASISLTISRQNGDSAQSFTMDMTEVGDGVYELRLPSLEQGKYNISAVAKYMDKTVGKAKTSLVVEEFQIEFAQTNQDRPTLQSISELSGGAYIPIDSADILPQKIQLKPHTRTWTTEKELWHSLWLLLIVALSLTAEWFIRKISNLL